MCAVAAVLGPLWEAGQRGPETAVRAYLAAVQRGDAEAALETLAPEVRASYLDRVQNQTGNSYRVEVLALGGPSVLARAFGASGGRAWATVTAEITPEVGERWKSTAVVDVVQQDGRWYLLGAPFA